MTRPSSRQLAQSWPFKRHYEFVRELRRAASRWFSKMELETHEKKKYSLKSPNDWPQNIICSEVAEYIQQENARNLGKEPYPLHPQLHHGLSSQAMIFNLVGPLIVRKDFEPLRIVIEQMGLIWPVGDITIVFEHSDRSVFFEDIGQPTSIDLVISGEKGDIFIEAKLVETDFGDCTVFSKGDCDGRNPLSYGFAGCFLHHIGRTIWDLMKEFGFVETTLASGPICPFTIYYQFYREILFSLKREGSFILLHDERSPTFLKTSKSGKESGLWPFLMESVPEQHSKSVGKLTIQQIVNAIDESGRHSDWIHEFKSKYGMEYIQTQLE